MPLEIAFMKFSYAIMIFDIMLFEFHSRETGSTLCMPIIRSQKWREGGTLYVYLYVALHCIAMHCTALVLH